MGISTYINNNCMLNQVLVLPRMRVIKNREIFERKKKKGSLQPPAIHSPEKQDKQQEYFIPYFLKTLNKISKKSASGTLDIMDPELIDSSTTTNPTDLSLFLSSKSKCQAINNLKLKSRKRSINPNPKPQGQYLQVTISNGNIHDSVFSEKDSKEQKYNKILRFKKSREKKSLTFRTIQAKTSREQQRLRTIQDVVFQDVISKTKYLHTRSNKRHHLQSLQSNSFSMNKVKLISLRSEETVKRSQLCVQRCEGFRMQQDRQERMQKKYQSMMHGFGSVVKTSKEEYRCDTRRRKSNIFNTFELTGW